MRDKKLKIAVLISGRGSNLDQLIKAQNSYQIVLVIANKSAEGLIFAQAAGIPIAIENRFDHKSKKEQEQAIAQHIEAAGASWICLAGYMSVLSSAFIQRFSGQIINIHPSLLPAYKGLNTHQRIIADKGQTHGASIHLVTADLDAGQVILQASCAVLEIDDEASLAKRITAIEHQLFAFVINALGDGELMINTDKTNKKRVIWSDKTDWQALQHNLPPFAIWIKPNLRCSS